LFLHAGRCARIARRFMPPAEAAELDKVMDALSETVVSLVVDHSDQVFHFSMVVSGMPEIGDVLTEFINKEAARRENRQRVSEAIRRHDWDAALETVEGALAGQPGNLKLLRSKFRILATGKEDRDAALACADAILKAARENATALNSIAWVILTENRYGGEYPDVALRLSERSNEITGHNNWAFVDTLALAKFETGDVQAAIRLQREAIELSDGSGISELKATLARFEDAAAGARAGDSRPPASELQ